MTYAYSPAGVTCPDVACLVWGGVTFKCYVWEDTASGVIGACLMTEQADGSDVVVARYQLGTPNNYNVRPQIVPITGAFVVHWLEDDSLMRGQLTVSTLSSTPTWATALLDTVDATATMLHSIDVDPADPASYVYAYENASSALRVAYRTGGTTTIVTIADNPINCLGVCVQGSNIIVSYQLNGTSTLRTRARLKTDISDVWTRDVAIGGTRDYFAVAFATYTSATFFVIVESYLTSEANDLHDIDHFALAAANGTPVGSVHRTKNLHLLGRPITWPSRVAGSGSYVNDAFVMVGMKSKMAAPNSWSQSNAYVADMQLERSLLEPVTLRPACQMNNGSCAPHWNATNHLSHAARHPYDGPYLRTRTWAGVVFSRQVTRQGANSPTDPMVVGWRFHPSDPYLDETGPDAEVWSGEAARYLDGPSVRTSLQPCAIGRGLVLTGGTPLVYDGAQLVELGFSWWPEILSLTALGAGSGLAAGTYSYTAVYEWLDARGQMHRSAPAIPVQITITAGQVVFANVLTQSFTWKQHTGILPGHAISIVLYRTTSAGTVYYRVTQEDNATNAFYVQFVDAYGDSTIALNGILPHQLVDGQWLPLENFQPPAAQAAANWKNRLWLASGDVLHYSHEVIADAGSIVEEVPAFHPGLTYAISEGGDIVALAVQDYGLVVLKRDSIWIVYGDGADRNGAPGNLDRKCVARGVGCMTPLSVVGTEKGVFFQSEKGIYLLSREERLSYVGAGVEDDVRALGTLRGAILQEDTHQVRFIGETMTEQGSCVVLCYDYLFDLWTRWELDNPESGISTTRVKRGTPVRAASVRRVASDTALVVVRAGGCHSIERTDNVYSDSFVSSGGSVEQARYAGRIETGWLRLEALDGWWRCRSIVVHVQRQQDCRVTVELAYDDGAYDARDKTSVVARDGLPVRVKPRRQQFTSIRLRVSDEQETALTEGIRFTGITLEVQRKPGHRKLRGAQITRE